MTDDVATMERQNDGTMHRAIAQLQVSWERKFFIRSQLLIDRP
jgi:hypothetical protein